jgi:hypothetical protein
MVLAHAEELSMMLGNHVVGDVLNAKTCGTCPTLPEPDLRYNRCVAGASACSGSGFLCRYVGDVTHDSNNMTHR